MSEIKGLPMASCPKQVKHDADLLITNTAVDLSGSYSRYCMPCASPNLFAEAMQYHKYEYVKLTPVA